MKKLITTLLIGILTFSVQGQRVIEKNIDYNDQEVNIEVPFASEIELKTWDRPGIYVKADLTTDEGKYLDLYELEVKESNNRIDIVSKAEVLFKKYQEDYKKNNPGKQKWEGNSTYSGDLIIHDGMEYKFDYVIYIPEGAEIKISSINGNLRSERIDGNFTADLINGNIDIEKYSGDMRLNTINGEINVPVGNSNMKAETIHGNIYAHEDLEFISTKRMVGQEIESKYRSGENSLILSTINGNMYLN